MKINPQDSQLDAAFDARCREMLSQRSVEAPPMAESTPPVSRMGQKSAWLVGAMVCMGLGFALWNGAEGTTISDTHGTVPNPILEPTGEGPVLPAEFESKEAPVAAPIQEDVSDGVSSSSENQPRAKAKVVETPSSGVAISSHAQSAESAPTEGVSSFEEIRTEPASSQLESVELGTSVPPVSSVPTGEVLDNAVEEQAKVPSEQTEATPALEGDEPVLRLPLTLPAGGGH